MNLSDILFARVEDLWKEAAQKPFVTEMAKGSLQEGLFRCYMLQDYLYLLDYIDILNCTLEFTADPGLQAFLRGIIGATENETKHVHIPNMKKIGITDDEIDQCVKAPVIAEYVDYMKRQLQEYGMIAGLTALLQCSWVYAYIGQSVTARYADEVAVSPYRSWFGAYTSDEYLKSNREWIEWLDGETKGIGEEETENLCKIFETCAGYENRFWDALYM